MGVVAQLPVLDDAVRDVDAEAGDAAVEPEAQDVVERRADVVVPPVQIGLPRQDVVQLVLARSLVGRPRPPATERAPPAVRGTPAPPRLAPDAPVDARRGARHA